MGNTGRELILITLLVKLGVAAAVSSSLARSVVFKNLLLKAHRTTKQQMGLLAMIVVPLTLGVWIRARVPNFLAADLSLEAVILLGLLFGPGMAVVGAMVLAVPAVMHHELWALPINVGIALFAGGFAKFVEVEEIWSFSPLIDLSLYRWVRRNLKRPHLDRQVLLLVLIMLVQFAASLLADWRMRHGLPRRYFALHSSDWMVELAICACAPVVVGVPLKIWDAIRLDRKLEEQTRLLVEARLDALQRQINPHFLFNTLNSIAALVRGKPELAREMVVKLANILRVLLKDREAFVPFSEELAFTDDYLAIEVVRFGEKLRVVKEISAETLAVVVPSMLLQPLIENSIKHGLEPRIGGGTVTLRSRLVGESLVVEVEDDGVGMAPEREVASAAGGLKRAGIGMRNVRERMEVLYGSAASVEINSRPGRGTKITLTMPVMEAGPVEWSQVSKDVREAWGGAVKVVTRR